MHSVLINTIGSCLLTKACVSLLCTVYSVFVCECVSVCDNNIHSKGVKTLSPVSSQKHSKPAHSYTHTHTQMHIHIVACVAEKQMCKEQRCINYPTKFTQ